MFRKTDSSPNIWMSFADLITGSLVVFIVITVSLVIRTRSEYIKVEEAKKKTTEKFGAYLKGMDGVQVTEDGVIRFFSEEGQSQQIYFKTGEFTPLPPLKNVIRQTWPKFMTEIKDAYDDQDIEVKEIRIEGHTDSRPLKSEVHGNLGLSQKRAAETWFFIRDSLLSDDDDQFKKYIESKVVSVGFGEQKLLNQSGELISQKGGTEDTDRSRRIELSILYESAKKRN